MAPSPVEELALLDLERSNKGASKQRRDQINGEIANMRDLLPLPESARQRLSQLQIMSLSCVYIRKCNLLQKMLQPNRCTIDIPCDFSQSLTGFILVTTRDGKLVYISENVTEYLGHSMVDMKTQGDSLFDIVDKRDHGTVQAQLLHGTGTESDPDRQVSFFCRMNMSRTLKRQGGFGDVKVMHIKGRFVPLKSPEAGADQHVFMALCCPLITPDVKESLIQNNTMVFKSVHKLDMSFIEITESGEFHLGLKNDQIHNNSWYAMLHPEDLNEARTKHIQLIKSRHEMGCMMTVRMITGTGDVIWVNTVMHVKQALMTNSDEPVIVCINQVVSEEEAKQFKIQGQLFALYAARAPDIFFGHHFPQLPSTLTSEIMPHHHAQAHVHQQGLYQDPRLYTHFSHPQSNQPSVPYPPHQFSIDSVDQFIPRPQGHHSTIKALKRKLQENFNSTCRPNKIQRLSHSDTSSNGHGIDYQMNVNVFRNASYEQFYGGESGGVHVFTGGQAPAVYPTAGFSSGFSVAKRNALVNAIAPVSSVPVLPDVVQKLAPSCAKEQVVPEVSIPDCYLTPDPSPASSPRPSTATADGTQQIIKMTTYVMDRLHELEKDQTLAEVPMKEPKKTKILPVIDATFVDSFFDDLVSPKTEMEKHEKTLVKVEPVSPDYAVQQIPQPTRGHVYAPTAAPSPPLAALTTVPPVKQELTFEDCADLEELLGLVESAGSEKLTGDPVSTKDLRTSSSMVASPHSQVSEYSPMSSYSPMSYGSPNTPEHYKSAESVSSNLSPGSSPGHEGRDDILDPDSWLLEPISLSLDMALPVLDTVSVDDAKLGQDDDIFLLKQTMPHPWAPSGVRDSHKDTQ